MEKEYNPSYDSLKAAIDMIDKYIDEHTANAHEMKDSHPKKMYYRGVDDTLSAISGILQKIYK